ncbi:MAG: DUF1934 domain-containing protein [Lachnospiraceae bacterium]|nr:DUF1934 domain-containing protein [Candidatus Colinaster equi]
MNKDVLISIKGLHFQNTADGDNVEVISPGQYYQRGDMRYLVYDEPIEGSDAVTKNMIKFNDSMMSLTKKGPITTSMLFGLGEKNLTNYNTPFGSLVIGLDTKHISFEEQNDALLLNVKYTLDVNYEFLADCDIHIEARNATN